MTQPKTPMSAEAIHANIPIRTKITNQVMPHIYNSLVK
jgi:hypothetical protein